MKTGVGNCLINALNMKFQDDLTSLAETFMATMKTNKI